MTTTPLKTLTPYCERCDKLGFDRCLCNRPPTVTPLNPRAIIMQIDPGTARVLYVALNIPGVKLPMFDRHLVANISGPLARVLYESLAGRHYWEAPQQADLDRAVSARRKLCRQGQDYKHPALALAGEVIANHPGVDPWLGTTKLAEDGTIAK